MPVTGTPVTPGSGSTLTVGTKEYFIERRAALYAQLVELEDSAASEYTIDNSGQRQSVAYRSMKEINDQIAVYDRKIAKLNSKGGRSLGLLRRGGY